MCGIIGIASNKSVSSNIIQSLKKLEYRGYDSAGIATIKNGYIDEKKCTGRVDNLEKILFKNPSDGFSGIGHRRTYKADKKDMPRNLLFNKMVSIISEVEPKLFLFACS